MIKHITRIKLSAVLFVFVASFIAQSTPANAFGTYEDKYSRLGIYLWDKEAPTCSSGTSAVTSDIKIDKSATIDTIHTFLTTTNLSSNGNKPLNDVQAAGIMGNMYAESGLKPDSIEATDRADKGHGLVQWTFGRWNNPSQQSAGLSGFAASKGKDWTDVTTQLQFLQQELQGSEVAIINDQAFINTKEPAVAAYRFRVVFERASEAVAHDDKREGAAITIYKLYGGSAAAANCANSNSIVAGDIIKTALNLALEKPVDNGKVDEKDARITYQNEKPKYNTQGDWSDCGAFIATVMIASGVDKNYPKLGVTIQKDYVIAHPEKYEVNMNPTLGSLKPGTILYTSGHTTMYTGEATYPSVDASWHERVPSVRDSFNAKWMIDNGAISARPIK